MVPDRLSYTEMYSDDFKYPSKWTDDQSDYVKHRGELATKIIDYMENYDDYLPSINKQVGKLSKDFFSGHKLYGELNG